MSADKSEGRIRDRRPYWPRRMKLHLATSYVDGRPANGQEAPTTAAMFTRVDLGRYLPAPGWKLAPRRDAPQGFSDD
jgi:hypothetical protein